MLVVKNLSVRYILQREKPVALDGISFTLSSGQVLGIAGESGCGKSTLAKAILGVLPSNTVVRGEVLYKDRDLLQLGRRQMDQLRGSALSMVFQDPSTALNPERKIRQQLYDILGGKNKPEMDAVLRCALSEAQLPDPDRVLDSYPSQLSGGMKQRTAIAAALLRSPELVIADEPTSALDASIRAQIIAQLMETQKTKQLSMLYISHNLAELSKVCSSILVMKNGRIVESGQTEALFRSPKDPYTKTLIGAVNS